MHNIVSSAWRRRLATSQAIQMANMESRVISLRVVKNMTRNGKIQRFSVMVASGNGKGGIGLGQATHANSTDAILKAGKMAVRNMEFFERWHERTLFHDGYAKFKASEIFARPAPKGSGRRCHPAIAEMCRCMGITDISAKVVGSRHPMNVAQAFMLLLRGQKTPQQVAFDSGMKVVDVLKNNKQDLSPGLEIMLPSNSVRRLAGCIPIKFGDGSNEPDANGPKLLLINSRKKRNLLVFPKGGIKKGEKPKLAAIRETFEEAGVAGRTIGRISSKVDDDTSSESLIAIEEEIAEHWDDVGPEMGGIQWFLLSIEMVFDEWPEMDQRTRTWVELKDAHKLDAISSGTRNLIKLIQRHLLSTDST